MVASQHKPRSWSNQHVALPHKKVRNDEWHWCRIIKERVGAGRYPSHEKCTTNGVVDRRFLTSIGTTQKFSKAYLNPHNITSSQITFNLEKDEAIMSTASGYVSNGEKRLKVTDVDEETLNSGAEGYDSMRLTVDCD